MNNLAGSDQEKNNDAGVPLPNFNAADIQIQTVAPSLGLAGAGLGHTPDYLEYDTKGRGVVVTMFANAGMSYLTGITFGGAYGFRKGLQSTPSNRFRVQLNSILNHCGRYGSRGGNTLGVFAIMYSLFEGFADHYEFDEHLRSLSITSPAVTSFCNPAFGVTASAITYYSPAGPRVAALAGSIGFAAAAATYTAYSLMGIPYGSIGYLWF